MPDETCKRSIAAAETAGTKGHRPGSDALDRSLRVITLDGPSGAGKSTLGVALANKLGWLFLDSGLLYRQLAYIAIGRGVSSADSRALQSLESELASYIEDGVLKVGCAANDLRASATADFASRLALHGEVRQALTTRVRSLMGTQPCVVAGRDAGTNIAPRASLQIYLTASLTIRVQRRARQLRQGVGAATDALERRDQRDRCRWIVPLGPTPSTVIVDTSENGPSKSLNEVMKLVTERNLVTNQRPYVSRQCALRRLG